MIPIVDMHVHLLAGLDDGPRTPEEAVQMCARMVEEGVQATVALAHQHPRYPSITANVLREATDRLKQDLDSSGIPLTVYSCGEICLQPDLIEQWDSGSLMSVGDRRQYLLLEFLNDRPTDLHHPIEQLRARKIRLILAHAERVEAWRDSGSELEEWVRLGCLVQVTSSAFTNPSYEKCLRSWARRGLIHMIGSDGHSPTRRPPSSREGVAVLEKWVGEEAATRIASGNALTILRGDPLVLSPPEPPRRRWFGRLFGN